jgi:hypothetical protein
MLTVKEEYRPAFNLIHFSILLLKFKFLPKSPLIAKASTTSVWLDTLLLTNEHLIIRLLTVEPTGV